MDIELVTNRNSEVLIDHLVIRTLFGKVAEQLDSGCTCTNCVPKRHKQNPACDFKKLQLTCS